MDDIDVSKETEWKVTKMSVKKQNGKWLICLTKRDNVVLDFVVIVAVAVSAFAAAAQDYLLLN